MTMTITLDSIQLGQALCRNCLKHARGQDGRGMGKKTDSLLLILHSLLIWLVWHWPARFALTLKEHGVHVPEHRQAREGYTVNQAELTSLCMLTIGQPLPLE